MHTGARAGQAHAGPRRSVCSSAGDTRENVSRVQPTSGRLAPGLSRGVGGGRLGTAPRRQLSSRAGLPSSLERSKLPPARRPARAHTHTPARTKGVLAAPPHTAPQPRAHGAVAAEPRKEGARDGGVDTDGQTDAQAPRRTGGDARGPTGRGYIAGVTLARPGRGGRAPPLLPKRYPGRMSAPDPRGEGRRRARGPAGRAGARSAPGEQRRQVSGGLCSRARLSPPCRSLSPPARGRPRARRRRSPGRPARAPRVGAALGARAGRAPHRRVRARGAGRRELQRHGGRRRPASHPGLARRGSGTAPPGAL